MSAGRVEVFLVPIYVVSAAFRVGTTLMEEAGVFLVFIEVVGAWLPIDFFLRTAGIAGIIDGGSVKDDGLVKVGQRKMMMLEGSEEDTNREFSDRSQLPAPHSIGIRENPGESGESGKSHLNSRERIMNTSNT